MPPVLEWVNSSLTLKPMDSAPGHRYSSCCTSKRTVSPICIPGDITLLGCVVAIQCFETISSKPFCILQSIRLGYYFCHNSIKFLPKLFEDRLNPISKPSSKSQYFHRVSSASISAS